MAAPRRAASVREDGMRQLLAGRTGTGEDAGRLNEAQGHTADRDKEQGGHAHRTGIVSPSAYTVNRRFTGPNAAGYRIPEPRSSGRTFAPPGSARPGARVVPVRERPRVPGHRWRVVRQGPPR